MQTELTNGVGKIILIGDLNERVGNDNKKIENTWELMEKKQGMLTGY